MIGNSSPAAMRGWAVRLCSTIVVPERGKPTMKIGCATSLRTVARGRIFIAGGGEERFHRPRQRLGLVFHVGQSGVFAQGALGFDEGGERLLVAPHLVEKHALLAPFERAQAAPRRFLFDGVEGCQRLVIFLLAAKQDGALQHHARRAGRQLFGRVQQFACARKIAVGLLHPRPAEEGLEDRGVELRRLLVKTPRFLHAALVLQVPGEIGEQDGAALRQQLHRAAIMDTRRRADVAPPS